MRMRFGVGTLDLPLSPKYIHYTKKGTGSSRISEDLYLFILMDFFSGLAFAECLFNLFRQFKFCSNLLLTQIRKLQRIRPDEVFVLLHVFVLIAAPYVVVVRDVRPVAVIVFLAWPFGSIHSFATSFPVTRSICANEAESMHAIVPVQNGTGIGSCSDNVGFIRLESCMENMAIEHSCLAISSEEPGMPSAIQRP
mgnify:CR=1 FL=1